MRHQHDAKGSSFAEDEVTREYLVRVQGCFRPNSTLCKILGGLIWLASDCLHKTRQNHFRNIDSTEYFRTLLLVLLTNINRYNRFSVPCLKLILD